MSTLCLEPTAAMDREQQAATVIVFPSVFGAIEVECTDAGVSAVRFQVDSAEHPPVGRIFNPSRSAGLQIRPTSASARQLREIDGPVWVRTLREAMTTYLAGERCNFDGIPLDLRSQPAFRREVLEACRRIPYGQTVTYAELAARAGNPAAVRAAGSAMSHNPMPIIIPCHRVLRSGGGLGGYSGPGGLDLKRRLLAMEEQANRK